VLTDVNSGVEKPAAIILKQCKLKEVVAPIDWMQKLRSLCDRHGILLICDDIQVGCGRTGPFFSLKERISF